jgi:hypothetical protein
VSLKKLVQVNTEELHNAERNNHDNKDGESNLLSRNLGVNEIVPLFLLVVGHGFAPVSGSAGKSSP